MKTFYAKEPERGKKERKRKRECERELVRNDDVHRVRY